MKNIDIVTLIMHFGSDRHRISGEAAKKIAFFLWSINYEYDNDFIESLGRYTVNVSACQCLRSILTHRKIKTKSKYKTRQQAFTFFKNFLNMEVELTPDIERRAYNYCTADALQYFKAYCWVYHNKLTEDKIARFGKNRKDSKFIEREWFEL